MASTVFRRKRQVHQRPHRPVRQGGEQFGYVVRTAVGVAGLITPWNTPFMLESWKLAPALASGCTLILKPAEWTPLSASLWPEICAEAGVPAGVALSTASARRPARPSSTTRTCR